MCVLAYAQAEARSCPCALARFICRWRARCMKCNAPEESKEMREREGEKGGCMWWMSRWDVLITSMAASYCLVGSGSVEATHSELCLCVRRRVFAVELASHLCSCRRRSAAQCGRSWINSRRKKNKDKIQASFLPRWRGASPSASSTSLTAT